MTTTKPKAKLYRWVYTRCQTCESACQQLTNTSMKEVYGWCPTCKKNTSQRITRNMPS